MICSKGLPFLLPDLHHNVFLYLEHGARLSNGLLVASLEDGGVADVAGHEGTRLVGHFTRYAQRAHVERLQKVLFADQPHLLPMPVVLWMSASCHGSRF